MVLDLLMRVAVRVVRQIFCISLLKECLMKNFVRSLMKRDFEKTAGRGSQCEGFSGIESLEGRNLYSVSPFSSSVEFQSPDIYETSLSSDTAAEMVKKQPGGVQIADFNADGIMDMVVAEVGDKYSLDAARVGDHISLFLGASDGSYTLTARFATGDKPDQIRVADVDGDTHMDVIVGVGYAANAETGNLTIWHGTGWDGSGTGAYFNSRQDVSFAGGIAGQYMMVKDFAAVDINSGDGDRVDLVVLAMVEPSNGGEEQFDVHNTSVNLESRAYYLKRGVGGSYTLEQTITVGNNADQLIVGDYRGNDDYLDFGVLSRGVGNGRKMEIISGTSTGFDGSSIYSIEVGQYAADLVSGDFNNDTVVDIAVVQNYVLGPTAYSNLDIFTRLKVYSGHDTGSTTTYSYAGLGESTRLGETVDSLLAADINGDGLDDLVLVSDGSIGVLYQYDRDHSTAGEDFGFTEAAWGFRENSLSHIEYDTHGVFERINPGLGENFSGAVAKDINGDGLVDLVLTSFDETDNVFVFENTYESSVINVIDNSGDASPTITFVFDGQLELNGADQGSLSASAIGLTFFNATTGKSYSVGGVRGVPAVTFITNAKGQTELTINQLSSSGGYHRVSISKDLTYKNSTVKVRNIRSYYEYHRTGSGDGAYSETLNSIVGVRTEYSGTSLMKNVIKLDFDSLITEDGWGNNGFVFANNILDLQIRLDGGSIDFLDVRLQAADLWTEVNASGNTTLVIRLNDEDDHDGYNVVEAITNSAGWNGVLDISFSTHKDYYNYNMNYDGDNYDIGQKIYAPNDWSLVRAGERLQVLAGSHAFGDLNTDGATNSAGDVATETDLAILTASLASGGNTYAAGDLNGDNVIDKDDYDLMVVDVLGWVHGDMNGDGIVEVDAPGAVNDRDALIDIINLGSSATDTQKFRADVNGDGLIDLADLNYFDLNLGL